MELPIIHTNKSRRDLLIHIAETISDAENYTYGDEIFQDLFNSSDYKPNNTEARWWINEMELNLCEMICWCQQREKEEFGELNTVFKDEKTVVNHYVYWYGQELLNDEIYCFMHFDINESVKQEDINKIREKASERKNYKAFTTV